MPCISLMGVDLAGAVRSPSALISCVPSWATRGPVHQLCPSEKRQVGNADVKVWTQGRGSEGPWFGKMLDSGES